MEKQEIVISAELKKALDELWSMSAPSVMSLLWSAGYTKEAEAVGKVVREYSRLSLPICGD
jgi:hypothetical protein